MKKIRPAAVPLITVDPFFSIWSVDDALYGGPTEHWCGRPCPIMAGIYVDGAYHGIAGSDENGKIMRERVFQRNLEITPLSTIYTFENEAAIVKLTFTTPLLPDRPDILARPISYVKYDITPKTKRTVRFVFGISSRACVDNKCQSVVFRRCRGSLACGNAVQNPLAQSGDCVLIDWGYLHLAGGEDVKVAQLTENGRLEFLPVNGMYNAYNENPYLITLKNEHSGVITVAYDEIKPIEYFGTQLDEYYTKHFDSFDDMLAAAVAEYDEIKALCDKFDAEMMAETGALNEDYKYITSLAYRQAVSAHKLVADTEGNILFLSKENDSNGCIGTLDVTYPSIPLFLKYNPELVKGMLRPIIKYAESDAWNYDFTPHDVGRYPLANGQVYGASPFAPNGNVRYRFHGEMLFEKQMPVEEAGNMLLCLAAVKKYSGGDQTLFDEHAATMKLWVDYLVKYGYDPENQLCTDDFAGHLARNCNLSLKAILGIAAYAELSGDASYMDIAREYAKKWEIDAKAPHGGTRLVFGGDDGWSLKYNIVWDSLLGYNLFSDEVKRTEIELYKTKLNPYGVPLDSRSDYTKIDWLMWSTVIWKDKEYFDAVCESIVNMINETVDRVPMTDWYYTSTAAFRRFRARSVVGGLYINLLK